MPYCQGLAVCHTIIIESVESIYYAHCKTKCDHRLNMWPVIRDMCSDLSSGGGGGGVKLENREEWEVGYKDNE